MYPRLLGGSHTHLFSKESISYLKKKYKFKIIGEWWFGTEFVDLYRSLLVSNKSRNKETLKIYSKQISEIFMKNADALQSVFDRKKLSSGVHLVIKK